jgi:hypothetical protein
LGSCNSTDCNIDNLKSPGWRYLDSNINFKLCSNTSEKLNESDSFEIEYLGVFKEWENILIQRPGDSLYFSAKTAIRFSKVNSAEFDQPPVIIKMIQLMTKKSVALLEFDFSKDSIVFNPERKLSIWFTGQPDSITAMNCVNKCITGDEYDSIFFVSKEKAMETFNDQSNDTAWKSLLEKNPLPVSVDVYVKAKNFGSPYLDSLRARLLQSGIVADVTYPSPEYIEETRAKAQSFKRKYYIRLKA